MVFVDWDLAAPGRRIEDVAFARDEPGMRRLRDAGAGDGVRRWHEWLRVHRDVVVAVLTA
ncbi:hypothetical protein [Micromonospora sp. NPDC048839]|uniref:hypothetical protein n=1 Tax=Micromonospora sp. NPDC048839 TaxID=3155641 RepID=UPI0034040DEA